MRALKKEPDSIKNRNRISVIHSKISEIMFQPDYMLLVVQSKNAYLRACKGFTINGVKYARLLGTNGGIKSSTIVFVADDLVEELRRRIDNGRNLSKKLVPAKFEAYRALVCSSSTPVSDPRGLLVVPDCVTYFKEDVITLTNQNEGEPLMELVDNYTVKLKESDGYGLMLPSLAERWSKELELGYVSCGFNTRCSFEKGMVFSFDFLEFAEKIAHSHMVKDAWGNVVDVRDVELILTTSMLKLWDSYDSCEQYLECCRANKYSFCITKECPEVLENQRDLNYQFIQSYYLTDEMIDELISPTVKTIRDVLAEDYRKTILFLKGSELNEKKISKIEPDYTTALMIDPCMMNDPYVKKKIMTMISGRINEARIGVVSVHGNYSIISGDPFSLCQNMFGMEVTGLLKAGEIYNRYWADGDAEEVVCFRAPMTCHNNIRKMKVNRREDAAHWYQYMNACTILNSLDSAAHAMNGADKDGDLVLITDNKILVDNYRPTRTIMCAQNVAKEIVPTEDDLIQSNIDSFGNSIGKITNRITSMFEVQSHYEPDSEEFKILDYRIKCGQLLQQDEIDKAKGIISKPMPREWYDWHAIRAMDADAETKALYERIMVSKKPFFMIHLYKEVRKDYNDCMSRFKRESKIYGHGNLKDLVLEEEEKLSDSQKDFLAYYYRSLPVGLGDCVMNVLCKKVGAEFDSFYVKNNYNLPFDYNILKSGADYKASQYKTIQKLYDMYVVRAAGYQKSAAIRRTEQKDIMDSIGFLIKDFCRDCFKVCSNRRELCDILLDVCYQRETSKQFAWNVFGEDIVGNLLENHGNLISFPEKNESGDIEFLGERFLYRTICVGGQTC